MEDGAVKCVMVIDAELPVGLQVNTAGVLAFTLGHRLGGGVVGTEVVDGSGHQHAGITKVPIPVLKAAKGTLGEIRTRAAATEGLVVVDFTDAAQTSKTYGEYTEKMRGAAIRDLGYLGLALYGNKKSVNRLTGSLPLLR